MTPPTKLSLTNLEPYLTNHYPNVPEDIPPPPPCEAPIQKIFKKMTGKNEKTTTNDGSLNKVTTQFEAFSLSRR